jgi:tetratricopeptide (TPR) repeat protein
MNPSTSIAVSRFNNEGVSLIESGLYDEAISTFSKGLTLVKQVLALQGDDDQADEAAADSMETSAEPASDSPICYFHKMQEPQATNECRDQEEVLSDEPFIFRAPLYIQSRVTDHASSTAYYVKSSFMILYNLALTHHLSALSRNDTQKRLQKALKLYELAYTIQMTEDIQLTVLQTMAIVNNLGLIHTALEDEEKARQCFQHLLSSIMFLNDCGDRDSVEHMDGFIANVMPLVLMGSSAPAAAA